MANTYTPNLGLIVEETITAVSKLNLYKLDASIGALSILNTADVRITATNDISLLAASNVNIGAAGAPVDNLRIYAGGISITGTTSIAGLIINYTDLNFTGGSLTSIPDHAAVIASNPDVAANTSHRGNTSNPHLTTAAQVGTYTSGQIDAIAATKVDDSDFNTHVANTSTHGVTGVILGTSDVQVVSNKTISALNNTITNLYNTNIASNASIAYGKLNLNGSVVNADISAVASIEMGKISGLIAALAAKEPTLTRGSLLTTNGSIHITGGSNAVIGSGITIDIDTASLTTTGLLSATDYARFNNAAVDATDIVSSTPGVTVTNGTGAAIGTSAADVIITIDTATDLIPGLLSAADHATFDGKQDALTPADLTGTTNRLGVTGGTGALLSAATIDIDTTLLPSPGAGDVGKALLSTGANAATWQTISTADEKLKVSATDTTAGYLAAKLLAGTGISLVVSADPGDAKLTANNTDTGSGAVASHNLAFDHSLIASAQPGDADLTAIAALTGPGMAVKTSTDPAAPTWSNRTIAGTANRIGVSNGDGVLGNPTISLDATQFPQSLAADTGKALVSGGMDTASWGVAQATVDQEASGIIAWAGSGNYYSLATGTFTVLRAGTGRLSGTKISWAGNESIGGLAAGIGYLIGYSATNTLVKIDVATLNNSNDKIMMENWTSAYTNNVILFGVWMDGAYPLVVKEDHEYKYNTPISMGQHFRWGQTFTFAGAVLTLLNSADRTIQTIGEDLLSDHGLSTRIVDGGGLSLNPQPIFMNAGGSGQRLAPHRFTVSGITTAPTAGAVYSNNSEQYTVLYTTLTGVAPNISGTIAMWMSTGTTPPPASGTLTKVSGTGDASIAYSSFLIPVSIAATYAPAGVPTSLATSGATRFGIVAIYTTKDDKQTPSTAAPTPNYFQLLSTTAYNSAANAANSIGSATAPNLTQFVMPPEFKALELTLNGFVLCDGNGRLIPNTTTNGFVAGVKTVKATISTVFTAGSVTATTANNVSLDTTTFTSGWLTAADANVQLAMNTIALGSTVVNNMYTATKEPTGFEDPANTIVTYNSSAQTITLTRLDAGTIYYWVEGVRLSLASGWTSTGHANTVGHTYWLNLSGAGASVWTTDVPPGFDKCFVAYCHYTTLYKFAIRECHGLMQWQSHKQAHLTVGSYRSSGGDLTSGTYAPLTNSLASVTPGVDLAVTNDEDLATTMAAWSEGSYTRLHFDTGAAVFTTGAATPYITTGTASTGNPQYNQNPVSGTALTTVTTSNRWFNVYAILVPTTADAESQGYRTVWLSGQTLYTSLASAQAEDFRSLSLGNLSLVFTEAVPFIKLTIIRTNSNTTYNAQIAAQPIYIYNLGNTLLSTASVGSSTSPATRYTAALVWAGAGPYTMAIAGSTHGRGADPIVRIREFVSGTSYVVVGVDDVTIDDTTGDIVLTSTVNIIGKVLVL